MKKILIGLMMLSAAMLPAETIRSILANNGFQIGDYKVGTYLDGTARLTFPGLTLEAIKDCDFFGYFNGGHVSEGEKQFALARRITLHRNGNDEVDKIVFQIPNRYAATYQKAVVVELTNGGGGVNARIIAARYINSNRAQYTYEFFTMGADGNCTFAGNGGSIANNATVGGYGVCGLGVTKILGGTPRLVFPGKTLEDLRGKYFCGYTIGAWFTPHRPRQGYNTIVTEDGDGNATKIHTELQLMDGINNKCTIVEMTNGEGGVYAAAVYSCYGDNTNHGCPIGHQFTNANGTYNCNKGSVATDFDQGGYGVHGLRADDHMFSGETFQFMTTTDALVNNGSINVDSGVNLANAFDFTGRYVGGWISDREAKPYFYVRRGNGLTVDSSISFEAQNDDNTYVRSMPITLTMKENGINARADRVVYSTSAVGKIRSFLGGGTEAAMVQNAYDGGYGLRYLGWSMSQHLFSATTDAGAWSEVAELVNASATDGITTVNLEDTVTEFDFDEPMTNAIVRLAGANDVALTMSGEPTVKYWDLTDLAGVSTIASPLENAGITAGECTVLDSDLTRCAVAVAEGRKVVAKAAQLADNGFHVRGSLKLLGDANLDILIPQWWQAESVELTGTYVFNGGDQGVNNVTERFLWNGKGELILSGNATFNGSRNYSVTTTMPGPIVVADGATVTMGDRVTLQAQNLNDAKGYLRVDGGLVTGGHLYMNTTVPGQQLKIEINGGRFETALRPWSQIRAPDIKIVQTGGQFAPSSLDVNSGWTGDAQPAVGSYTFKGGVFEPPAGWREKYQWLPMIIPADGDVEFKVVTNASYPCRIDVAEGAQVAFSSTDDNATLTLPIFNQTDADFSFRGEHQVRVDFTAALTLANAPTSTVEATWVKVGDKALAVLAPFAAADYQGSIKLEEGTTSFARGSAIGGVLTMEAAAALVVECGEATDMVDGEALFSAAGGIVFPAGKTVTDCIAVSLGIGSVRLSDDGKSVLYVAEPNTPITSVWTGAAGDGDYANAANWASKNVLGADIVAAPQAPTYVHVANATDFAFPANTVLAWRSVTIESASLKGDLDWSGLSTAQVANGALIDLNGHTLQFSGEGATLSAFTVTNSVETAGTLRLAVAEGKTLDNTAMRMAGKAKFVKEGPGTFIASCANWQQTEGFEVEGGEVKTTLYGAQNLPFGFRDGEVVVKSGASLDLCGKHDMCYYLFTLAGGTLKNSVDVGNSYNWAQLGRMRLTADSRFECAGNYGFLNTGFEPMTVELGGHTLTLVIGYGKEFIMCNTTVQNGVLDVVQGGWFRTYRNASSFPNAVLKLMAAPDIQVPINNLAGYETAYDGPTFNTGDGLLNVTGYFKPVTSLFHSLTMANGSTFDLSAQTTAWRMASGFTTGPKELTFADNATIYIDIGDRQPGSMTKVLDWEGIEPANLDTLTFRSKPGRAYAVVKKADGVYVYGGMIIFVR